MNLYMVVVFLYLACLVNLGVSQNWEPVKRLDSCCFEGSFLHLDFMRLQ